MVPKVLQRWVPNEETSNQSLGTVDRAQVAPARLIQARSEDAQDVRNHRVGYRDDRQFACLYSSHSAERFVAILDHYLKAVSVGHES